MMPNCPVFLISSSFLSLFPRPSLGLLRRPWDKLAKSRLAVLTAGHGSQQVRGRRRAHHLRQRLLLAPLDATRLLLPQHRLPPLLLGQQALLDVQVADLERVRRHHQGTLVLGVRVLEHRFFVLHGAGAEAAVRTVLRWAAGVPFAVHGLGEEGVDVAVLPLDALVVVDLRLVFCGLKLRLIQI